MMSVTNANYYPNALCFKDKSKIQMANNWFGHEFKNPMIVIEMCNQKYYSGKCKEDKEIKEFLEQNFFYFGNQETLVNRLLYDYSDKIDFDFSENGEGDIETYYPLMKIYRSQIYQNIEKHNEDKVEVVEIMYGFDEIEIDDYYFQIDDVTDRGREFVNQKSIRTISDKVSSYIDKER
jgi:hypothetical protein